jgi:ectoine hydroxylase-related dioxygenase (phytanoyl-CoA dioxygenase family)
VDERSKAELETKGFALLRAVVDPGRLARLAECADEAALLPGARQRHGATFAARGLLAKSPRLAKLLDQVGISELAGAALGEHAFAIDALLFDKIPESNWKVPGHQDVVMPVRSREDEPGFSSFTEHDHVVYVQPPAEALERLVAARVHLDDSTEDTGAIAVVPGTHRKKLGDEELRSFERSDYRVCEARAGDVLLMKPLLLHRSAPARVPSRRRVLHVVYACREPGERVRWLRASPS